MRNNVNYFTYKFFYSYSLNMINPQTAVKTRENVDEMRTC